MTSLSDRNGTESVPVGPPPPFDPTVAAVVAAVRPAMPELRVENLPLLRSGATLPQPNGPGAFTSDDLTRGGTFSVEERTVPGPEGAPEIPLTICRPVGAEGAVPLLYYIHGGGMVMGDRFLGLAMTLDMAEAKAAVISVEYRLAPEHPHPAPVEDCYAGLVWAAAHADELGIDPGRIVVGGASAGGGLSAAVALLARDRGGPALIGQWLGIPMLDDRCDTPSTHQMAGLGIWDRDDDIFGWTCLLGDARGGPDVSPYAAPARAGDLSGLPPAFIDVASTETFRDEAVTYANRIWLAGGVAELHVWPGGCHGFTGFAPHAAISIAAEAALKAWFHRIIAG